VNHIFVILLIGLPGQKVCDVSVLVLKLCMRRIRRLEKYLNIFDKKTRENFRLTAVCVEQYVWMRENSVVKGNKIF